MAKTATLRRPAPVIGEEPQGLTWGAMKAAAEVYFPGLGGKVADQLREWNRDLFDNKLQPAPLVLGRMSSVNGNWFPLIDRADQRIGMEGHLKMGATFYMPPDRITFVKRGDLLRGAIHRLRSQDGLAPYLGNSQGWCTLIMDLHFRLTGKRIWCAPEYAEKTPVEQLGGGLYRPEETQRYQDSDPETGAESLPKDKIANWPGSVMDLGRITRD